MPPVADLFLETHSKEDSQGRRLFASNKDKDIYENYVRASESNTSDKSDNELWFDTVHGYNKGAVYGCGNAQDLYFNQPRRRQATSQSSQTYVPGIVSQLQEQLDQERRANAARDEEMRLMKEQFAMMQTFFPSCNFPRPPPRDPRDPGDGSGGASMGFIGF